MRHFRDVSTLIQNSKNRFPRTLPTKDPTNIVLQIKLKSQTKVNKPNKYSYIIPPERSHPQTRAYIQQLNKVFAIKLEDLTQETNSTNQYNTHHPTTKS